MLSALEKHGDTVARLALAYNPDVWAQTVSEGRFTPFAYQRTIMRAVAKAVRAGGGRILVNAPSRHGKSTACSKWLPAWFLEHYPDKRVILGSYGQQLSNDLARDVRDEFRTNRNLRTKLSEDSQAVNAWRTTQGGAMFASGVDGPLLGRGFTFGVIDDPHQNWEQAHSPIERDKIIRWFGSTFSSRQDPGAVILIDQQRMHQDDLSGWLIQHHPEKWTVLRFPALDEHDNPLCPSLYSREQLHEFRDGMDPAAWLAMFQQDPSVLGSGRLYHQFIVADHVRRDLLLRNDLPLQLDFDFNRNPGMHIEIGQYDKMRDLLTVRHEVHSAYLKLEPALEKVTELIRSYGAFRWPALEVYGDATGTQERAETTQTCYQMIYAWAARLRHLLGHPIPLRVNVPASNPPVRQRIDNFNACLHDAAGDIHFAVHPDCLRLIADLKDMKEDEQGLEDKRDIKLSHASSATGYRITWLRPLMPPRITSCAPVMM